MLHLKIKIFCLFMTKKKRQTQKRQKLQFLLKKLTQFVHMKTSEAKKQ